jgi:hypothetical protein
MIGVSGATACYRTAVAALPLRTRAVEQARDAVVIIEGSRGWPERSVAALQEGAAALLVEHPVAVRDEEIAALEDAVDGRPIVLERPWLRPDVVADAAVADPARHVTVDVVAIPSELSAMVRDAIGWLRVLTGDDLELRAATARPHGLLALWEEPISGRAAAVTASALVGLGGARLRAHAVGETRVEIDLDAATDLRSVEIASADGVLRRPRRHEAGERIALRRVVDALADDIRPGDLRGFRRDSALAAEVCSAG